MPSVVAEFLNLPNPKDYTGHCFRRSSASLAADSDVDLISLKRLGGWKSSSVAESYIEESVERKKKICRQLLGEKQNESSTNTLYIVTTEATSTTSRDISLIPSSSSASFTSEMEKKKLSSAENQKRKAVKELEKDKLRSQPHKFFKQQNTESCYVIVASGGSGDPHLTTFETAVDLSPSISSHQHGESQAHQSIASESGADPSLSFSDRPTSSATEVVSKIDILIIFKSNDPETCPKFISVKIRKIIVEHDLTKRKKKFVSKR
ncbi:hypothetical protein Zmor_014567 [Zophobas morio]|uniref:Tyr recombinase domain-containing protein n=1 Tax=Zophobas morio TaxID=2755281 RepID=A0AA38IGF2_9CUCU|nr:hypothetical protein Zmor_014567 [Zophobas morio]